MTSRLVSWLGIALLWSMAACGGGGGGGGGGIPQRYTLTVSVTGATAGGRITSTPAGIDCPASCSATFDAGTAVSLAQAPAAGHLFGGWTGGCTGTGACAVTLSADRAVQASFDGPTDVTVSTPYGYQGFPRSLLPGETLTVPITTTLARGAPGQVTLTVSGLPTGLTGTITPPMVNAGINSTLSLTAAAGAPVTATPAAASVTATGAYGARSVTVPVEVRSPRATHGPVDLAFEHDGATSPTTALVLETVPGFQIGRLVRVSLPGLHAVRTIATGVHTPTGAVGLGAPRALSPSPVFPSTHALVAHGGGLTRVGLSLAATDAIEPIAPSLGALGGVRWYSATKAIVTECGAVAGCAAGRLSEVDLATGAVTAISTSPLNDPAHVLGTGRQGVSHLTERGAGRVISVAADGTTWLVAQGLDRPTSLAHHVGGGFLVTTAGGAIEAVGPYGGPVRFLDLAGAGPDPVALTLSPAGWQEALVAGRSPDRLLRLRLVGREPAVNGPVPGGGALSAPRAFTFGNNVMGGYAVTDCGPGGEAGCALTGRVVRLSGGQLDPLATGLDDPRGLADGPYVSGNAPPLLVAEHGAGRLLRINLDTLVVEVVATGLPGAWGVALEDAMAGLALVSTADGVYRVALATGAVTLLAPLATDCGPANHGRGIATGLVGSTPVAFVAEACPPQVTQVDLATGVRTPHPLVVTDPRGVQYWSELHVTDAGAGGRFLGSSAVHAAGLGDVREARFNGFNGVSYLTPAGIASTTSTFPAMMLAQGLDRPSGMALEPSGTEALLLDCGGTTSCDGTGRLLSLDLMSGAVSVQYTGLTAPAAVAREGSLRVLVADCQTATTCASAGRLSRIEGGVRTTLASALADPAWVAVEASGTTALVAERSAGRITRVDLASGATTTVATGLAHPRQVVPMGGGASALVAEDGRVAWLDLATGVASTALAWDAERFVVVPPTDLVGMLPRRAAPAPAQLIATGDPHGGAVTVWGMPLTDTPDTAIWAADLGRVYYTEGRSRTGGVYWFTPLP